ncbi:MAG TPA: dodecin family protein [Ktedonobacteraceae bacterium]|jgi:flavin-binding protein dodecin|nr:dodecin family protein [Ktedonobacteraceae bacterium]
MAESVYKVIELVGTSHESWEKAAAAVIEEASHHLRDLRVARIVEQDIHIEAGKPLTYRLKMELSFKYERTVEKVVEEESKKLAEAEWYG